MGLPPIAASTAGNSSNATAAPETARDTKADEPKKKRSFWGRIFGRGDDDDKKKEDERKKKEEERKKAEQRRPGG